MEDHERHLSSRSRGYDDVSAIRAHASGNVFGERLLHRMCWGCTDTHGRQVGPGRDRCLGEHGGEHVQEAEGGTCLERWKDNVSKETGRETSSLKVGGGEDVVDATMEICLGVQVGNMCKETGKTMTF